MPAPFIVLDGPDATGTTTHAKMLAERIRANGHDVVLTAEPTNGPIGGRIREFLKSGQLPPESLQLLFTADRAWHLKHEVMPALSKGTIVVCDRYIPSTIAYGKACGLDGAWLEQINGIFPAPLFTIFTLPPFSVALERMSGRPEHDSMENGDLQKRVFAAYEEMAKQDLTISVADTSGNKDATHQQIWNVVQKIL